VSNVTGRSQGEQGDQRTWACHSPSVFWAFAMLLSEELEGEAKSGVVEKARRARGERTRVRKAVGRASMKWGGGWWGQGAEGGAGRWVATGNKLDAGGGGAQQRLRDVSRARADDAGHLKLVGRPPRPSPLLYSLSISLSLSLSLSRQTRRCRLTCTSSWGPPPPASTAAAAADRLSSASPSTAAARPSRPGSLPSPTAARRTRSSRLPNSRRAISVPGATRKSSSSLSGLTRRPRTRSPSVPQRARTRSSVSPLCPLGFRSFTLSKGNSARVVWRL